MWRTQQVGPASMATPGSKEAGSCTPEGFAVTATGSAPAPAPAPVAGKAKSKGTRKDRAKRLLLSLTTKHAFQNATGTGTGTGAGTGTTAAISSSSPEPSPRSKASPAGGDVGDTQMPPSPLVTATDAATVRPGMVLASVAALGGQGVSEEAVDTLGMGVKEAIETLIR